MDSTSVLGRSILARIANNNTKNAYGPMEPAICFVGSRKLELKVMVLPKDCPKRGVTDARVYVCMQVCNAGTYRRRLNPFCVIRLKQETSRRNRRTIYNFISYFFYHYSSTSTLQFISCLTVDDEFKTKYSTAFCSLHNNNNLL